MNITQRLAALFKVRSHEIPLVSVMLVQAFLFGIPGIVTEAAAYSLFLDHYSAQDIPLVFIGFAITSVLVGLLFTWLDDHIDFMSLMVLYPGLLFVVLATFRILLVFWESSWPIFALTVWAYTMWVLVSLAYWNLAGRLFNIRQSKRLFGLFGAVQLLSEILFGLLTPLLVRYGGVLNLLVIAAAATGMATIYQIYILRHFTVQDEEDEEGQDDHVGGLKGLWELIQNSYVQLIFIFTTFSTMVYYFLDNVFYDQADARFETVDETAAFVGLFFAISGIITAFVSGFASSRFFKRFGIRGGLILQPLVLIVGTGTIMLANYLPFGVALLFWLILGTKLVNQVFKDSLETITAKILYQPLPATLRLRVQTVVESIIEAGAAGLAGLVLLTLNGLDNYSSIYTVSLSFVMLWIVLLVAWRMAHAYPKMIRQAWSKRELDGNVLLAADSTCTQVLEECLCSREPDAVIYALDLLEKQNKMAFPRYLPSLLEHQAAEVRLDALQRVQRLELTAVLPAIQNHFKQEHSEAVRRAALKTLATIGDVEQYDFVSPYLDSSEPELVKGAAVGLLCRGDIETIIVVYEKIQEWMDSEEPAKRAQVADILGESEMRSVYRPLLKLLSDGEPSVRRAALQAASKLNNPKLWPILLTQLSDFRYRKLAISALAAADDAILPLLESTWLNFEQSPVILASLAQISGKLGSQKAIDFLATQLNHPHLMVRTTVLHALRSLGYQAVKREPIENALEDEVAQASNLLATSQDIEEPELISTGLKEQLAQHRARLFCWLSFLYEPLLIEQIEHHLSGAEGVENRAFALDLLDETLPTKLSKLLLPLLEEISIIKQIDAKETGLSVIEKMIHLKYRSSFTDLPEETLALDRESSFPAMKVSPNV